MAVKARHLLDAVRTLDSRGRFLLAWETQLRHEVGTTAAPFDLWPDDIERGKRRRDEALSWLRDFADAFDEPQPKPLPDKSTRGYLIILDLAAMYEVITGTRPTRRNKTDAEDGMRAYGPFFGFVSRVYNFIGRVESIDSTIKLVLRFYPSKQFSTFILNLQFRHPRLWQKIKPSVLEIYHSIDPNFS